MSGYAMRQRANETDWGVLVWPDGQDPVVYSRAGQSAALGLALQIGEELDIDSVLIPIRKNWTDSKIIETESERTE